MPNTLAESEITNYVGTSKTYNGPTPTTFHPPKRKEFTSPQELLSFIDNNTALWPNDRIGKRSQASYWSAEDIKRYGTTTWEHACRLAREGWADGCKLLVKASNQVSPLTRERVNQRVFDVAGVAPHVPRFVAGDPEYMLDFRPVVRGSSPVLKVAVSPNCGHHVTNEQRAIWGAAIISWINHQIFCGNIVDVITIYVSRTRTWYLEEKKLGPPIVIRMKLKAADQDVFLPEFAFWLMHNAAHRRMQFAVKERMGVGRWYSFNEVYGLAIIDADEIATFCSPETLVLPFVGGISSVDEGLALIENRVAEWERKRNAATEVAASNDHPRL